MVKRRDVITGGLAAGATALAGSSAEAAQQRDESARVADAINELRKTLDLRVQTSPELARIREQQRLFLRSNQKFPDFMEVGIGVWENVYDWHVRHQHPVNVFRLGDGRYAMTVIQTTLILRPDQAEGYVGYGFDGR
jgi:hypothetical protein